MASIRLLVLAALHGGIALAAAQCQDLQPKGNLQTAPGVQFKLLANDLNRPRGVIVDAKGNLLVVESGGKGIRRIELDGGEGLDACVKSSTQLVDESSLNHGIQLSSDGKTLFASSSTDVFAYSYDADKGTVGSAKNVITGMDQNGHSTRTLLIPKLNSNLLLVSRGSNANIDQDTTNIDSARSQIRIFNIDDLMHGTSAAHYSDGKVLGWGLRNSVGVGEDPVTGHIWSVENSIDDMKRDNVDVHNTNPGEELNYHGSPSETNSDVYGKNYGYPECVAIVDLSNIDNYPGGAVTGEQMRGDQMPSNYTDTYCQEHTLAPYITFGSHLAPLDIKFNLDASSALITFHGSWDREPPNGYRLSRVEFSNGFPTAQRNSTDAEQQLMWNADNMQCPGSCVRPVALAFDSSGKTLFMTSDSTGELYLVTGADTSGGTPATSSQPAQPSESSEAPTVMGRSISILNLVLAWMLQV